MPIFLPYALKVRVFPMGLQKIFCVLQTEYYQIKRDNNMTQCIIKNNDNNRI